MFEIVLLLDVYKVCVQRLDCKGVVRQNGLCTLSQMFLFDP